MEELIEFYTNLKNKNAQILQNKTLTIISTHTDNEIRYNTLINNLNYLQFENNDIIIINSANLEYSYKMGILCYHKKIRYYEIANDVYYDFGKWINVLKCNENLTKYEFIFLTNDSYLMTNNINHFYNLAINTNVELYGYNDSTERKYHYQSYLFCIRNDAVKTFIDKFECVRNVITDYDSLINMAEIQMTDWFNNIDCFLKIGIVYNKDINIFFQNDYLYDALLNNSILPFIKLKSHDKIMKYLDTNIKYKDLTASKIFVIYVYYERINEEKNQTNLSFFINYALDDTLWINLDITYVFVINGSQSGVIIPKKHNIHTIYNSKKNYSDYEGWYDGISYLKTLYNNDNLHYIYDYMCLINCSTCGPIMENDIKNHWLYPFYNRLKLKNAIACSPYANKFFEQCGNYSILSCHFTLFKLDEKILNIFDKENVLGKKIDKNDAIQSGEFGLSISLVNNNYNICCLFYDNINNLDGIRREFIHETNDDLLFNTIFIKNIWRNLDNTGYAGQPVLYNKCKKFIRNKLKQQNIFNSINVEYNTNLIELKYSNNYNYDNYGYAEEYIIFPIKGNFVGNSCLIYAHYDERNIIANYVLEGLKSMIFLGYDIFFYTACEKIINVSTEILPFEINYILNEGAGTDWKVYLKGCEYIKNNKLNYEWIMVMNDSLLFPINGVHNFLNSIHISRQNCDFWGHWESEELQLHLVCIPIEYKNIVINDFIEFLNFTIPKCNNYNDYIHLGEIKLLEYLCSKNYKYNSIVKSKELIGDNAVCKIFNPYFINQWINNINTFAIKWKYCISYLNKDIVSSYFNYLAKYLHYGPYGTISKGEILGAFPISKYFTPLKI